MAASLWRYWAIAVIFSLALFSSTNAQPLNSGEVTFLQALMNQCPNCAWPALWTAAGASNACTNGWSGIYCLVDPTGASRIYELDLADFTFTGTIPSSISNLAYLETLNLNNLGLTGSIPTGLGTITNLSLVSLELNSLTGEIPTDMWTLCPLQTLILDHNQLTGTIPDFGANLASLSQLSLANNRFYGSIPTSITTADLLLLLILDSNNLTGSIPMELYSLPALFQLDLSSNFFSGEIPVPSSPNDLIIIDYSNNLLTGSVPDLSNFISLSMVSFGTNGLTGTIPETIGNLGSLSSFIVRENSLTGTIPAVFTSMHNLTLWDASYNGLNGTVPSGISSLSNLTHFAMSYNSLSGTIPPEICSVTGLSYLDFSSNDLVGVLPDCIGNLVNLTSFYSDFNALNGTIPASLGGLTQLTLLALSSNQLTGSIPPQLANATKLQYLLLGNNQLNADVPYELSALINLIQLDLSYNSLTGPIPFSITKITGLQQLLINNNNISCPLGSFSGLPLTVCDASQNWMCGSVSDSIFSPTCAVFFPSTCKLTECKHNTSAVSPATNFASAPLKQAGSSFSITPATPAFTITTRDNRLQQTSSLSVNLLSLNENIMMQPSDIFAYNTTVLNSISVPSINWTVSSENVTSANNPTGAPMWIYSANVSQIAATLKISVLYLPASDSAYVYNVSMAMPNGGVKVTVSANNWALLTRPAIKLTWAASCVFSLSSGSSETISMSDNPTAISGYRNSSYPLYWGTSTMPGISSISPVGQYGVPGALHPGVYLTPNTTADLAALKAGTNSFNMAAYFVMPSTANVTYSYDLFFSLTPTIPPPPPPQPFGNTAGFSVFIAILFIIIIVIAFTSVMYKFPRLRRRLLPCLGRAADPIEYL